MPKSLRARILPYSAETPLDTQQNQKPPKLAIISVKAHVSQDTRNRFESLMARLDEFEVGAVVSFALDKEMQKMCNKLEAYLRAHASDLLSLKNNEYVDIHVDAPMSTRDSGKGSR